MKKLIAMLLAVCMVLGLAACGGSTPAETTAPAAPEATEAT
ncbi:MAG TPA: ABC transporter substrate-binding protein, partial [Candidatus Faecousia faecipullorum]|nr:ABC transporter substrate-binding protein [Candidatus Faecousia faecipullorum]